MSKFTKADVAKHNKPDAGLYVIVDQNVYDITNFIDEHPGGAKILKRMAGKDATKQFWKVCLSASDKVKHIELSSVDLHANHLCR